MAYSKDWFVAFLFLTARSSNVSGHLLRNPSNSSDAYEFKDAIMPENDTILSDQFQNHDGGVTDSPSGFLCLDVARLISTHSMEKKKEKKSQYVCHYRSEGVIISSLLSGDNSNFDEDFRRDSRLFLKGATYDKLTNTIEITPEVQLVWFTSTVQQSLESRSIGTKTVLLFHVTNNGIAPRYTAAEISNYVFGTSGDKVTMTSQFKRCSYEQLKFKPAVGENIVDGVVEVFTNEYYSTDIQNAAKIYAQNVLGIPVDSFDHLMFSVPEGGACDYYGSYEQWGKNSCYSDIKSNQVQMFGIGQNLGLAISFDVESYWINDPDRCSAMGMFHTNDDLELCFNGVHMMQLGWYKDRVRTIDPRNEKFSGKIISVIDYGVSTEEHIVVLEIIGHELAGNLFLTWNRAQGMTKDVQEYQNEIIVTQGKVSEGENTEDTEIRWAMRKDNTADFYDWYPGRDLVISFKSVFVVEEKFKIANVEVYLTRAVASS